MLDAAASSANFKHAGTLNPVRDGDQTAILVALLALLVVAVYAAIRVHGASRSGRWGIAAIHFGGAFVVATLLFASPFAIDLHRFPAPDGGYWKNTVDWLPTVLPTLAVAWLCVGVAAFAVALFDRWRDRRG